MIGGAVHRRRLMAAVVTAAAAALFAACGSGGDDVPDTVRLAGTVIPTATPEPTPIPVCDPPVALPVPANFPVEVRLPETIVVWKVITSPHLRLEGRVRDPTVDSITAHQAADLGITQALRFEGFTLSLPGPNGGYIFSADNGGRRGEYLGLPILECPGHVEMIY
ncbi:MAG: hypothetical protein HY873_14200 [Chloroflexi bacterium]|nr:hypothetical protein [Chloroflexota bacterium]